MRRRLDRLTLHRFFVALALGGAVTGLLLSSYSWATARPEGLVGQTTEFLVRAPIQAFAICAVIAIVVLAAAGVMRRRPADAPALARAIALGATPVALIATFFTLRYAVRAIDFAEGPGTASTARYAIVGVAFAITGLIATSGALTTIPDRRGSDLGPTLPAFRIATAVVVVILAATALSHSVSGTGSGASASVTSPLAATAAPSPSVPSRIAYRIRFGLASASSVVPVGGGFVVRAAGKVTAYDGVTGEKHWSRTTVDMDAESFASETGGRPATMFGTETANGPTVTVVGPAGRVTTLDATTGAVLWWTSDAFTVLGTSTTSRSDAVVVGIRRTVRIRADLRPDSDDPRQLVALDTRTGAVRWSKPLRSNVSGNNCGADGDVIGSIMLFASNCVDESRPVYVDLHDGSFSDPDPRGTVRAAQITAYGDRFSVRTAGSSISERSRYVLYPGQNDGGPVIPIDSKPISDVHDNIMLRNTEESTYGLVDLRTQTVTPLPDIDGAYDALWTWVGDTAVGFYAPKDSKNPRQIGFVSPGGRMPHVDTPCLSGRGLRIRSVSGAVLVSCVGSDDNPRIVELVGLR